MIRFYDISGQKIERKTIQESNVICKPSKSVNDVEVIINSNSNNHFCVNSVVGNDFRGTGSFDMKNRFYKLLDNVEIKEFEFCLFSRIFPILAEKIECNNRDIALENWLQRKCRGEGMEWQIYSFEHLVTKGIQ